MLFSVKWLKELVDIPCTTAELVTKFNLMSSEVEGYAKMVEANNLVVGHVLTCVDHPQSDHLHICEVDVSTEVLQIICGAPNVAAGQKVIVALEGAVLPGDFKIKKSTIRGVESRGMICSLDELGVDHKYHQEDGIHILPQDTITGSNPLEVLNFDDEIIELSLTPNRGDLMSMMGIAFDVSAMLNTNLHLVESKLSEVSKPITVEVSSKTALCKSYYARIIQNITIKESPYWLKARLIAAGIRPINNVVDITNSAMLETGQPLHAFDYDKLKSKKIVVRNAAKGETIVTLDGKVRELIEEDIVITDGVTPIALAGVMGGESTQIDENTKTILLESAIFEGLTIRKTSKRLDLRSESSSRFERGLDPNRTILACNRAASLFADIAIGEVLKGVSFFETQSLNPQSVVFTLDKLIKVTGYQYNKAQVEDVLRRLHFDYKEEKNVFNVSVPTRRFDIKTYQDIIEEVVRIAGYELIPTTLHRSSIPGKLTNIQKQRRLIRNTLVTLGLNETISYSLTSESEAKMFDFQNQPSVKLSYPIVENRGTMRHSQIPALLDILSYNIERKMTNVQLFEIGKGYTEIAQTEYVSAVLSGTYDDSKWQKISQKVDFFLVKGLLEALFDRINVQDVKYLPLPLQHNALLHPGISAVISVNDEIIGWVGKLHPSLQVQKGLPDVFAFEINLLKLIQVSKPTLKMKEIAKYPSVSRDLAIVVDTNVTAQELVDTIKKAGKKTLTDVKIFDVYQGENIESGKKSLALTLVFQDYAKTLSTEEVDQYVTRILKMIAQELNGQIRS